MAVSLQQIPRSLRCAALGVGCWLLLTLTSATPTIAGPVSGLIRTVARPGTAPAAKIVYAEPLDVSPSKRPGKFTLRQKNKAFLPRIL